MNGYSLPGNRRAYIPPGWDFWVAGVDHSAYSNFNYELNDNGTLVRYGDSSSDYLTDVIADRADAFLDGVTRSSQPFMLYLAPYAPHSPATPAPRHKGQFSAATAPRTTAFNEQNVRDKPRWVRRSPPISPARKSRIDEGYAQRLEALQAVDELIDSVMQRLADSGALRNTYVLFLSDNGYFLGEHRQPHGKDAPYDAATRVPLIARGPGISSGGTTGAIALNIDILPTLLSLAGAAIPAFVDGRSLQPLFDGNPSDWRRTALLEGFGKETESTDTGEQPTPAFRALRTGRILYVEYDTGERELYDLRGDPHQLSNVVKKSSKALRRIYSRRLQELSTCTGDSCREAEDAPLANRRRDVDHTRRASDGKRGRHEHHRDTRRERRR